MRDDSTPAWLVVLCALAGIVILTGAGLATSWFGLVTNRPMQAYAEDTRRLTFEHSKAHRDGVNDGVSGYCLNMEQAKDPQTKQAFAHYVQSQVSSFEGPLTADAERCATEARAALRAAE